MAESVLKIAPSLGELMVSRLVSVAISEPGVGEGVVSAVVEFWVDLLA